MYSSYFQNMSSPMESEGFNGDPMYSGNIDSTINTTPSAPNGSIDSTITTTPARPDGNIGSTITTTPSRPDGGIGSTITTTPSRPDGNIDSTITTTPSRPNGSIGLNIVNWPLNYQVPAPPNQPIHTILTVFQTCINGLVNVRLKNGESFWMIPTDFYGNAIYGYQWDEASGWYPSGIYFTDIISVTCAS